MRKTKDIALGIVGVVGTLIVIGAALVLNLQPETNKTTPKTVAAKAIDPQVCYPDPTDMANQINAIRLTNGVGSLKINYTDYQAAAARISDMEKFNFYGHINPQTKSTAATFLQSNQSTSTVWGEILDGPSDANVAIDDFKNSPPHLAQMISSKYTQLGIATSYEKSSMPEYDDSGKVIASATNASCLVDIVLTD